MPIIYSSSQERDTEKQNIENNTKQEVLPKKVKRNSRLHRSANPKILELTDRRINEMCILFQHRLATTDVFQAVLAGSDQQIRKELRYLWDNSYIDRPLEQWIMHKKYQGGRGRSEIIYALTNTGARVLQDKLGIDIPKTDLNRKNSELGETTIFHDVALTKLWACLHTALEEKRNQTGQPYNLVLWYQDRVDREQLKTELLLTSYGGNGRKISLVPDAVFKFQCPKSQYLFLVEYYRTRKGGHQAYLDHLKLYNVYYQQGHFKRYEVKKGFRVITMVPSRTIMQNLVNLINTNPKNSELRHFRFWFVSETDWQLYHKEKVPNKSNPEKTSTKQTKDVQSILKPIFRTSIDNMWHRLEE